MICIAMRSGICGLDVNRLMTATEEALKQGLEVWISPEMWDKSPEKTLAYVAKTAESVKGCVNNGQRNWCSASVPS